MPSLPLVPSFIINPVLRQARRFSRSSSTSEARPTPQPQAPGGSPSSFAADDDAAAASSADATPRVPDLVVSDASPSSSPLVTALSGPVSLTSAPLPLPGSTPSPLLAHVLQRGAGDDTATVLDMSAAESDADGDDLARRRLDAADAGAAGGAGARPLELPEDDGMGALRERILHVQSLQIPTSEKALLMHFLLMESYNKTQQLALSAAPGPGPEPASSPTIYEQPLAAGPLESLKFWQLSLGDPSSRQRFLLTEDDRRPTYAPRGSSDSQAAEESLPLGCEHYRRNVKLQCATCHKWYTCRLCHDDVEDHALPRKETKNMLCMPCGYAQRASDECVKCGTPAARYYCSICKLWNDHPDKSNYHCHDCGICRVGAGLGKDFFHCKSCGICIAIGSQDTHRCREGAMDCDCPICGEYMFTSTKHLIHMDPCRHIIHKRCYDQHMQTSYKCPICYKSARNVESLFRKWDKNIEEQPMPPEWRDCRAIIYCNDCEAKSQTLFHWIGLKCSICQGYNTREVRILNAPSSGAAHGRVPIAVIPGISSAAVPHEPSAAATDPTERGQGVGSTPRDIAQPRRTIGHHPPGGLVGSHEEMRTSTPIFPPDRFARSLSPTPLFMSDEASAAAWVAASAEGSGDDDDDEDFLGMAAWARVGLRSVASGDAEGEEEGESSDGDLDGTSDEDEEDDDDDDDEDDEINLLGHR